MFCVLKYLLFLYNFFFEMDRRRSVFRRLFLDDCFRFDFVFDVDRDRLKGLA